MISDVKNEYTWRKRLFLLSFDRRSLLILLFYEKLLINQGRPFILEHNIFHFIEHINGNLLMALLILPILLFDFFFKLIIIDLFPRIELVR